MSVLMVRTLIDPGRDVVEIVVLDVDSGVATAVVDVDVDVTEVEDAVDGGFGTVGAASLSDPRVIPKETSVIAAAMTPKKATINPK